MTREEKIQAIRAALSEEQRTWLCEVIEAADVFGDDVVYDDCSHWQADGEHTLAFLAREFR